MNKRQRVHEENPENFSNNEPNPEDGNIHPLLLVPVLEILLDNLEPDISQLKQLRLVCRAWRNATLVRWRKTAVLTISPEAPILSDDNAENLGEPKNVEDTFPVNHFYKIKSVPFTCYKLRKCVINVFSAFDSERGNGFWQQIGPLLNYIQFQQCQFVAENERDVVQLLIHKTPNLKELAIENIVVRKSVKRMSFKCYCPKVLSIKTLALGRNINVLLAPLIEMAVGLETIQGLRLDMEPFVLTNLMNQLTISKLRNRNILPKLKHLDMLHRGQIRQNYTLRWSSILDSFAGVNLKLETVTCDIKISASAFPLNALCCIHSNGNINAFLRPHAESLKVLKLFRPPFGSQLIHHMFDAQMTALTEIYFWGTLAPNFRFLRLTPNLKKLHISIKGYDKWKEMRMELLTKGRPYTKMCDDMTNCSYQRDMDDLILTEMESLHIDYAFEEKSLRKIARWMPNLKVLETILLPQTLQVVCKQWCDLRELVCLHESDLNDYSVIGTPETAGLVSLKELETFKLFSTAGPQKLTNASIEDGFVKLPKLKTVVLCCNLEINSGSENILKNHVRYLKLDHHNVETHQDPSCECCRYLRFLGEIYATAKVKSKGITSST